MIHHGEILEPFCCHSEPIEVPEEVKELAKIKNTLQKLYLLKPEMEKLAEIIENIKTASTIDMNEVNKLIELIKGLNDSNAIEIMSNRYSDSELTAIKQVSATINSIRALAEGAVAGSLKPVDVIIEIYNRFSTLTELQNNMDSITKLADIQNKLYALSEKVGLFEDVYTLKDKIEAVDRNRENITALSEIVTPISVLSQAANRTAIVNVNNNLSKLTSLADTLETGYYNKTETNALLLLKEDKATIQANYFTKTETNNLLNKKADKTTLNSYYTKAEVDKVHKELIADIYTKPEISALMTLKVDKTELEKNYTNNANLNKLLNAKVSTGDLTNAVNQRKADQASLLTSVNQTASELQKQINTQKTELTTASANMTASLTNMQNALTATNKSINDRYDELLTNVTAVSTQLSAKDTDLQSKIDTINSYIPNTITTTNTLADKEYVREQVASNAARAISADADGAGFASLAALIAGPWYSLGEVTTPTTNDYAVVKKDSTHSGNDVRYNYDGKIWVFFQEFQSGSSWTPTTAQQAVLDSGITTTKVNQIDTNTTAISTEAIARENMDNTLLARIATEEGTRETAVNKLTSAISEEKLARENADNQLLSKIEQEALDRVAGDNEVKTKIETTKAEIETTIGSIATLNTHTKTSIVDAINDLHTETHNTYLATDGSNQMNSQLDIVLAGSGDLLLMKAGDKGVNFNLDATTGVMGIVPESAPTTGFEVSYNSLKPRTSAIEYNLGDNSAKFTNAYMKNINNIAVDDFLNTTDITRENLKALQDSVNTFDTKLDGKVNKTGDEMTGELKITIPGSGDLIHMEAGGKGVTFSMDATSGYMNIIPVSAPTTGFEMSANTFMPRTTVIPYSLGSSDNKWTNLYVDKINDSEPITLNTVVSLLYPVGSIYISMDATFDPNVTWEGTTWEKIKEGIFLEATEVADTAGTEKEAGLPNITGSFGNILSDSDGCFKSSTQSSEFTMAISRQYVFKYVTDFLDASRSSAVYGKSDTVQPHSITCFIWRRTA